jgi:endonuclease III
MSGAFTKSTIACTASSLASLILYASSPEKVAKYLVKNLKESFAELEFKKKKKKIIKANSNALIKKKD